MINYIKRSKRLFYFASFFVKNNKVLVNTKIPLSLFINHYSETRLFSVFQSRGFLLPNDQSQLIISRNKSKNKKKKQEFYNQEESSDEEEDEDEDEDFFAEEGGEVKTLNISSLRTDLLLKSALGISRKKIEEYFYSNKIRLNGKILLKKSYTAQVDDEIDVIKKVSDYKANTLDIDRIKILKVKSDPDNNRFIVKAQKFKSLIIDNYEGANSWTETEELN